MSLRPRSLAVVLLLAVTTLGIGFAHKYPCHDGVPRDGEPWIHACYSDILPLYGGRGLADGLVPYLQADLEYPVLTGAFMAAVGLPVNALGEAGLLGGVDEGLVFFWATAAVLVVLGLVTVWAVWRMRRDRPWDAAMLAVAPGLAYAAGINWDLLAVALTTLALLAWSGRRPGLSGALFGLAVAAKFYPLVILGPLVVLCLRERSGRSLRAMRDLLVWAAASWLAVNLPVMLLAPARWARFYAFSGDRGVDDTGWGTLWFIGDTLPLGTSPVATVFDRLAADTSLLNVVAQGLFALCCAAIAALVWFAPRRPRVASVAFLVVAAFILTNKVWSPQFVLWLLPLAVLARPRWQFFLVWQAAELAYHVAVFRIFLDEEGSGLALTMASIGRWLAVAALAGMVVYETLRPAADPVRAGGVDDPDAGVLADPREADAAGASAAPDPTEREPALVTGATPATDPVPTSR